MNNWYELSDKNIADIESAIDWFKHNEEKLTNCMIELWNVTGEEKEKLSHFITEESNKLRRYYRLCSEKQMPHEVKTAIQHHLKPFIVELG